MGFDKLYMVNQGELEELSKSVFSKGDAYIAVDIEGKKVYIWLGSKCSVDEKGVAAAEARRIDDSELFNGAAKIVTYDEGDESPEFLAKLGGLRIVNKNFAKTMLKNVSTGEFAYQDEHVKALFKVSSEEFEGGVDAIKYTQVPFEKASLDSDDCIIADLGTEIWVWQGKNSNVKEKVKAMQVAREYDADRAGAQTPKVFMEGDGDEEFLAVFEGKVDLKQDRATYQLEPEDFDEEDPEAVKLSDDVPDTIVTPKESVPAQILGDVVMVQRGEGRLKCPQCGNISKNMMREIQDKTRILNDYPLIYAKKFVCGSCGATWRREE